MISPATLPRDGNGLVCGAWRLVHKNPAFSGELGVVPFRDGISVHPVTGHTLSRLSAIYGHVLYMEHAPGVRMPEGYSAKVPESFLSKLQRAPWRVPAPAPAPKAPTVQPEPEAAQGEPVSPALDSLDDMSREDLIALAELHAVDIDRRWGVEKLRAALRAAGVSE